MLKKIAREGLNAADRLCIAADTLAGERTGLLVTVIFHSLYPDRAHLGDPALAPNQDVTVPVFRSFVAGMLDAGAFANLAASPASMVASDDLEIFERCQRGLQSAATDWIERDGTFWEVIDDETGLRWSSSILTRSDESMLWSAIFLDLLEHLAIPAQAAQLVDGGAGIHRLLFHFSCSSFFSASLGSRPSLRVTKAATACPFSSCAFPTTAASATAGWSTSADSTSVVEMRWPETFMTSSTRPSSQR